MFSKNTHIKNHNSDGKMEKKTIQKHFEHFLNYSLQDWFEHNPLDIDGFGIVNKTVMCMLLRD